MISQRYKCIFICIPESESNIREVLGYPDTVLRDVTEAREIWNGEWNSYFKFSFVRNPWERVKEIYFNREWPGVNTFNEFCQYLEVFLPEIGAGRNQINILAGGNDLDFIGRYENLREDFMKVCDKIGLIHGMPLKNGRTTYRECYSDEAAANVAKMFKKDINFFGYKF